MQIRKNTKAYKSILEIVTACQSRPDRSTFIRLYITKAGHTIEDRINVEGIQGGDAGFFYDMSYDTVLNNLKSSNHQLLVSDDVAGLYFFHSTSNKSWDETPFEFDEAVLHEFRALQDLPVTRKKEKAEKFVLQVSPQKADKQRRHNAPDDTKKPSKTVNEKSENRKPKGPDFKLRHDLEFTNLSKTIYRQPLLNKEGVLTYYYKIADHILPYLKDRPLNTRRTIEAQKPSIEMSTGSLFQKEDESVPRWVKQKFVMEDDIKKEMFLSNDKEQLLFYVETGSLAFEHGLCRINGPDAPDFLVIVIDSPEFDIGKAVRVACAAKEVFDGLKLRSSVKTDGISGLHVYFALDAKSSFDTSRAVAEMICKLIRLKLPDLVSLPDSDETVYGKVTLDYSFNAQGKRVIAPYSLVPGQSAIVATPLLWEEVNEHLRLEEFTVDSIFKRLQQRGDPLQHGGKKINADDLLTRLLDHYAFLI